MTSTDWLQLAARASMMSWNNNCSAEWAWMAAYYRAQAEAAEAAERAEREKADGNPQV